MEALAADRNPSRPFRVTILVLGFAMAFSLFPAGASATHLDDFFNTDGRVNVFGSVLPAFAADDTSNVDSTEQVGESLQCTALGTVDYGSTNWYEFNPHRNGQVSVAVGSQTAGFEPVIALYPFIPPDSTGPGVCRPADGVTGVAQLSGINVTAGSRFKVQIGGDVTATEEGDYRFELDYDADLDGDGLRNSQDGCDTVQGPISNGGCPLPPAGRPDGDRDGIFNDGPDKCPAEDSRGRDTNRDGCLDPRRLDRTVIEDFGGFSTASSYRITKFLITGVPAGARISAKCLGPRRRGKRRSCGSQTIRSAALSTTPKALIAKSRRLGRLIGKRLRRGSTITVRVTARKSIGRYIRITIIRKGRFLGTRKFRGCMNQGAKTKFKRRGCR